MDMKKTKRSIFQRLTLRKAMMAITVIAVLAGLFLESVLLGCVFWIRNEAIDPYLSSYEVGAGVWAQTFAEDPSTWAAFWWHYTELVAGIGTIIIVGVTVTAAAYLFYRLKLKTPLRVLTEASERIAENDLDFEVEFTGEDEMGKLCESFELMRSSLEDNYKAMWHSVQERKRLNAAFSHDLRTPLTVLKGYAELLPAYIAKEPSANPDSNERSNEKLLNTVSAMSAQINRIERYVENMNALQRLEDLDCKRTPVSPDKIISQMVEAGDILCRKKGLEFRRLTGRLESEEENRTEIAEREDIWADSGLISQVFENLISNAVRFAKTAVTMQLQLLPMGALRLWIGDDGPGFSEEDLRRAAEPFYQGDAEDAESGHFGLGLYISSLLCEKHGGSLMISNEREGGGLTIAEFSVAEVDK